MSLKVEGKVVKVLSSTKVGESQKQDFIIETNDKYPKKICFTSWKDNVDFVSKLVIGENITVLFNAESKEFNEKWYTNLIVWKIEKS